MTYMARRRPSSDGMVRERTDGHWEGRIDKERRVKHLIYKNPTEKVTAPKPNHCPKQILNNKQPDKFMAAIQQDDIWRDFFYTVDHRPCAAVSSAASPGADYQAVNGVLH